MGKLPFLLLPLLIAAGCAADRSRPWAPVENVRYSALGHDPFGMLAIGDDRIVLRLGHDGGEEAGEYDDIVFPRTLPRTVGDVRTWESGDGTQVIAIESRPGPCIGSRRIRYEHHVTVRLSGRELTGCGGRLLTGRRS